MRHKVLFATAVAGLLALGTVMACTSYNANTYRAYATGQALGYALTGSKQAGASMGLLGAIKAAKSAASSSKGKDKSITGSDKMKTVVRKTGSFEGINVSRGIRVVYSPNEMDTKVVVQAPDNVLEYLTTEVKDGVLVVGYSKNVSITLKNDSQVPTVYVTGRSVSSFTATSNATIVMTHDVLATGNVDLEATSSGQIVAEKPISAPEVEVSATSSGIVKLNAVNVSSLAMTATSSATVKISKAAVSGPLAAHVTSSAAVELSDVTALAIDAGATSSGMIRMAGTCPNTSYSATTSGSVMAGDLKCTDCTAEATTSGTIVANALNLSRSTSTAGSVSNAR